MTALLRPDETLTLGVNVIVRLGELIAGAGQESGHHRSPDTHSPPQDWVALTGPCPTCEGTGHFVDDLPWCAGTCSPRCALHRLRCGEVYEDTCPEDDCRDGRRIVPLYRECQRDLEAHPPDQDGRCIYDCPEHDDDDCVLVGRGSIEVVPVVAMGGHNAQACIEVLLDMAAYWPVGLYQPRPLPFDPLPVPGRDFGVVIDVTELA